MSVDNHACSLTPIQQQQGLQRATMAGKTGDLPRSRDHSIIDESIDLTEYEEPDTAVNKHLEAGTATPSSSNNGTHVQGNPPARNGSSSSSSISTAALNANEEDQVHVHTIEHALSRLKQLDLEKDKDWDKVASHEKGVIVSVRKSVVDVAGKHKKVPLFRGEKFIQGFTPEQVFEVVGRRSLWDDWYDSGNLVADLNNSTSMTYMNMHIPGTARPRDLALIERVEASQEGTIYFAATSIDTNKVPHVHGRTRAYMALNGWILKPFNQNGHPGTWCSYFLQIDPHGLTPFPLATKMVSKRLVHIYKIEEYLKKNGTPRSAGTGQNHVKSAAQNGAAVGGVAGQSHTASPNEESATAGDGNVAGLPPQVPFDSSHSSASAVMKAKESLEQLLAGNGQWEKAVDTQGNPLYTRNVQDSDLPIMKGEASMPSEVTTEQVLGTLLSSAARRIWNETLQSSKIIESITGPEQCLHKDTYKGIHPHLPSRTYTLARGVFRSDPANDNGDITCVATSSNHSTADVGSSNPSENTLQSTLDYAGWRISSDSGNKVQLTNAIKINMNKPDLPDFIKRILIHGYAGAPAKVAQCIKEYGHPPYFMRWSQGKMKLEGEIDDDEQNPGDMKEGRFAWKIAPSGKSSEGGNTGQIAWLQYSSTMYPSGIALQCSSSGDALKAAKVEGYPNTVQINIGPAASTDSITLQASRHRGSNSGDILWNEQLLNQTVTPPRGSGGAIRRVPTQQPANEGAIAGAVASTSRRKDEATSTSEPRGVTLQNTSKQLGSKVQETATDLATVHKLPVDEKGRRHLPDDAMLILTRDLYFTRKQMALITTLLILVWCAARYL